MRMRRISTFLAGTAMAGALLAFVPGDRAAAEAPKDDRSLFELLDMVGEVMDRIHSDYVEEVSDKKLVEAAVRGMLRELDPHSSYFNPDDFKDLREQTRGEFGGLGIEVTAENDFIKVVSPIDDTPAFRAGLKAGDLITAIDGKSTRGITLNEAVDRMRGAVGTALTLTIFREGQEPFDVSLTRDRIKVQSVRSRLEAEGTIGYLRISSFNEQTQPGLEKAITALKEEGKDKLVGYLLDLRNNPGGLLDQAVSVSDTFLERGEIVSTRGRNPDDGQRFQAKAGDLIEGMPLVVLINDGSASASEIVAGALQDHSRAVLLGTRSFGKGSVQTIMPIGSGGTAIKLTTSRYYTPSGRSIQETGILPDVVVEQGTFQTVQRTERHESDLTGALRNESAESDSEAATAALTAEEARTQDYQLAQAIRMLQVIALDRRKREVN